MYLGPDGTRVRPAAGVGVLRVLLVVGARGGALRRRERVGGRCRGQRGRTHWRLTNHPGSLVIEPRRGARLTLIALRSCVPARVRIAPDVMRLGHRGPLVSIESAVEDLARRPKPLACFAELDADVLVLNFPTLPPGFLEGGDSLIGELYREQFGDDYRRLSILCLGRDDWTITTIAEFESWQAAYPFLGLIGFGVMELTGAQRAPADALEAARRLDVVRVHDFRHPDIGEPARTPNLVTIARIEPSDRGSVCVRCDERQARFTMRWYFGEHAPRTLCQRCIDEELTVSDFDAGRQLDRDEANLAIALQSASTEELARLAEDFAIQWALRRKPPFIQDFIDHYQP